MDRKQCLIAVVVGVNNLHYFDLVEDKDCLVDRRNCFVVVVDMRYSGVANMRCFGVEDMHYFAEEVNNGMVVVHLNIHPVYINI